MRWLHCGHRARCVDTRYRGCEFPQRRLGPVLPTRFSGSGGFGSREPPGRGPVRPVTGSVPARDYVAFRLCRIFSRLGEFHTLVIYRCYHNLCYHKSQCPGQHPDAAYEGGLVAFSRRQRGSPRPVAQRFLQPPLGEQERATRLPWHLRQRRIMRYVGKVPTRKPVK